MKQTPSEDSSSPSPLNGTAPAESEVNGLIGETPQLDEEGHKAGEEATPEGWTEGQQDVDDDSDDSEVSEGYDEEEVEEDEDEEDEEELSNGMLKCRALTFVNF